MDNQNWELCMRDIDRIRIIRNVLDKRLTNKQAAKQLDLSKRQVIRLKHRYRRQGVAGLIHGLRGQVSNNQLKPRLGDEILQRLRQASWEGFGPTFAHEQLMKKGLRVGVATVRTIMIKNGLWKAHKPSERHRAWRPRRDCLGELIQVDGSDHPWFEDRAPRCWLIAYIDDATSRLMYAELADAEDTVTLMRTTQTYLRRHGRPLVLYVDKDSIYKTSRQPTVDEELQDLYPITQYTRAMSELGIEVICAHSPQAKGRVERLFNTLQDRLVKELRLRGISTKEEANRFLQDVYIPEHNARFAIAPANTTDAHRPLLKTHRLCEILSLRTERTLANDFTVRFNHQYFQVLPKQGIRPRRTLQVEGRLDGAIFLRFKGHYLQYKHIPKPAPQSASPQAAVERLLRSLVAQKTPASPAATHPWRRYKGGTQLALLNAARSIRPTS